MDNKNAIHIHSGVLFGYKEKLMKFTDKWIKLGKNILREVTQAQKGKRYTFYFILHKVRNTKL